MFKNLYRWLLKSKITVEDYILRISIKEEQNKYEEIEIDHMLNITYSFSEKVDDKWITNTITKKLWQWFE